MFERKRVKPRGHEEKLLFTLVEVEKRVEPPFFMQGMNIVEHSHSHIQVISHRIFVSRLLAPGNILLPSSFMSLFFLLHVTTLLKLNTSTHLYKTGPANEW